MFVPRLLTCSDGELYELYDGNSQFEDGHVWTTLVTGGSVPAYSGGLRK